MLANKKSRFVTLKIVQPLIQHSLSYLCTFLLCCKLIRHCILHVCSHNIMIITQFMYTHGQSHLGTILTSVSNTTPSLPLFLLLLLSNISPTAVTQGESAHCQVEVQVVLIRLGVG